jgi:hypothetical protein
VAGREPTGAPKPPAKGGSLTSSAAARETLTNHRPKAGLFCREARGALPFCSRHSLMPVGRRTGLSTSTARNRAEIAGNPHSTSTGVHSSARRLWIERMRGLEPMASSRQPRRSWVRSKCSSNRVPRARQQKTPPSGAFRERMMGLEPTTFCMASRRSSQLSYIRGVAKYSRGSGAVESGPVEGLVHEAVGELVVLPADGAVLDPAELAGEARRFARELPQGCVLDAVLPGHLLHEEL